MVTRFAPPRRLGFDPERLAPRRFDADMRDPGAPPNRGMTVRAPRGLQRSEGRMINPVEFGQEVRTEAKKVVWPSRREVLITTAMVFVLSAIASVFFLLVD